MSKLSLLDENGNPIGVDETPAVESEQEVLEDANVEAMEYNPEDFALTEQLQHLSVALAEEMANFGKLLGIPINKNFMFQAMGFFRGNLFEQMFFNFLQSQGIVDVMDILTEDDVALISERFKESLQQAANVQSAQVLNSLNQNQKSN